MAAQITIAAARGLPPTGRDVLLHNALFTTKEDAVDAVPVTKDKLVSDLKVVVEDAEELLRATTSQAGEKVAAARVRIEKSLDTARVRLAAAGEAGIDSAKVAARATDTFVHEHPWQAVGIGAAVGVILGMLIARR
jgi:ElaB/YqjD/DUF883 family membrane-anchored ribosome-binding protein